MSKRSQLDFLRKHGVPTPNFVPLSWEKNASFRKQVQHLKYPLAVRSSFSEEDSAHSSHAGQFTTHLEVEQEQLETAIRSVFDSYPIKEGQEIIIQEMLDPDYSGVLFAYRSGVWKLEITEGLGEDLVGGRASSQPFILPRFQKIDAYLSRYFTFWRSPIKLSNPLRQALVYLSFFAGKLLAVDREASFGLDIEFAVKGNKVYLLQARPVTTPEDQEEVLTTANHKEILPAAPSPFMTSIISSAGTDLFGFYQKLDPSLPTRAFILERDGMPWINLSALLDTMLHWGLPTSLVCQSVGAEDFYRVGLRPWRLLQKLPVFFRLLRQQSGVTKKVHQWVNKNRVVQAMNRAERVPLWEVDPEQAYELWQKDFRQFYIELVTYMQLLTGAMSGPIKIADRLGWLKKYSGRLLKKSASTDYYEAFSLLQKGLLSKASFLRRYGHRAFYESDIGQKRFLEYSEQEWLALLNNTFSGVVDEASSNTQKAKRSLPFWVRPVFRLMHAREWIRHLSMQFFWLFRKEIQEQTQIRLGQGFQFSDYRKSDLSALMAGQLLPDQIPPYPKPSGWDMDTFLANGLGRRIEIGFLFGPESQQQDRGIGIYPGLVRGQVWRVNQADLSGLQVPPYPQLILVADALDPGWVPYFSKVRGVVSYVGGLLSHASIILREAGIPSITQYPSSIELLEGTWVEMDGRSGCIRILDPHELSN